MNKTLFSVVLTLFCVCASAIAQAALPISSAQTTDFDSLGLPQFADIDPPNDVIDDLTYGGWRYDLSTGPSPGIISRNRPVDNDIATTTINIRTADSSEFMAISIDFSTFGPNEPYSLGLYGYLAGTQVPGYVISRPSVATAVSETLTLNWDNIDEIRVTVNSDWIVFDNVIVGPATSTPSATATPIPTISAYGLVLTAIGLLFLAGRHLRTRR